MLKAYLNKDIKIIKVSGDDAKDYLNNIITNNIEQTNFENSIYSCLLTPQGKFLADFFITNFEDGYFLLVHSKFLEDLIKGLNFYKLRSKINIEDISHLYKYCFIPNPEIKTIFETNISNLGHTATHNSSYAFIDPRIANLGVHIVTNDNSIGKNELELIKGDCLEYFLSHGLLSMHLIEDLSKFYPLENNLHMLNAIDFKKGCYVGQELTARMKLRNKIPRTILPFILDLKNDESHIKNEVLENNTAVGEIIFQKNEYLFGHITFRKLSKDMSFELQFSLKNQKLKINHQSWLNF